MKINHLLFILGIFLPLSLLNGMSGTQELSASDNVLATWISPGDHSESDFKWKASWIWTAPDVSKHMMLARKTFQYNENNTDAILRITASDRYHLYVNGTYVCRGPARSAPHHQSYDILNISNLLVKGENILAVRVHQQEGKKSYQHDGRAGLLAQLNYVSADGVSIIVSDSNWKVVPDPSWSDDAPKISRFQDFVCDRVDFREYPAKWMTPGYDDSYWQNAIELMRNVGWPAPQKNDISNALIPPWTSLVPRDIPYLTETDIRAEVLLAELIVEDTYKKPEIKDLDDISLAGKMEGREKKYNNAVSDSKPYVIAKNKQGESTVIIFDFGEVVIGMPKLEIEGAEGTIVDIMCAPYILEENFTHKIVDTRALDRITLSGNIDKWEATYFKPTRYMAVAIRNNPEKLRLHYAGLHEMSYPFVSKGMVSSPEAPWLDQYWKASEKTINVCTTDGFTDNYRERRQYAQTGYYAALGTYWTFGDYDLQRKYLIQVAQEQMPNGIMPAYAPSAGSDYMVIFDSNCLWLRSFRNYVFFSGDETTVKELLPAAKSLMALFHSYTSDNALLTNTPYAYWLDHAPLDRRGANFTLNAHYLGALEDFREVLRFLGDDDEEEIQQRAVKLRTAMHDLFWDEEKELFSDALIDNELSDIFSEHSNGMALAMHIADAAQTEKIASQLLKPEKHNFIYRESGMVMVTPAMYYFLHKGLCEAGYIEASFNMFRDRFDHMLAPETNGTLWEEWFVDGTGRTGKLQKKTRSDAQTESAFPPALIAEYVFGLTVISPGMKVVELKNIDSGIRQLEGVFPSPNGNIHVAWDRTSLLEGLLELEIPEGMEVRLDLDGFNHAKRLVVDGVIIGKQEAKLPYYMLSSGSHSIRF